MVLVRVTYENQDRAYEVAGSTYREVRNSLTEATVPVGIFYFLNPRRIVTEMYLDDEVTNQELYYGINNLVLLHTSQLFDNLNNPDRVREHLEAGADPNLPNSNGNTPLHWAVDRGYLEVVSALLAAGAEVNLPNQFGSTPLHRAADRGSLEIVQALLAAGAEVNLPDRNRNTPLHWAASRESLEIIQELLNSGADPNLPNRDGNIPLHWTASRGRLEMVQALIQAGAIDTSNKRGVTAEAEVRRLGYENVADYIRDCQPDDIKEPEEKHSVIPTPT